MTAPTPDELRLQRFEKIRPVYTGLAVTPEQIAHGRLHWRFPHVQAVERYEEAHRRMFCRECVEEDVWFAPILVDYDKDPLQSVAALAETLCASCGITQVYPVRELFDFGSGPVNFRVFGFDSWVEKDQNDMHIQQMQALQNAQNANMQGHYQQAKVGNYASSQGGGGPGAAQMSPKTLFNQAVKALGKKTP